MEFDEELYERILSELSPPDGEAVSSAYLEEELGDEFDNIGGAISDLIRFGELEFVNTSGSNMHVRVRLRKPVQNESEPTYLSDFHTETVWLAYVVSGKNSRSRRAQRLFQEREAAEDHLRMIASIESLTPVPGLEDVWCESITYPHSEYAVLRKEPVFSQADDP